MRGNASADRHRVRAVDRTVRVSAVLACSWLVVFFAAYLWMGSRGGAQGGHPSAGVVGMVFVLAFGLGEILVGGALLILAERQLARLRRGRSRLLAAAWALQGVTAVAWSASLLSILSI